MSRTTRIKNNYRLYTRNSYRPLSIPAGYDWDYKWIDGEEIGKDPDFQYLMKVPDTSKEGIWSMKKWAHADGKAHSYYGGIPSAWVYRYFNRKDRHIVNSKLRKFSQIAANDDDIVLPSKKSVPYAYF